MKATSAQNARKLLDTMRETLKKENVNLDAYERFKGEWEILYNGKSVWGGIPTIAIPYALWSVYFFMEKTATK